MKLIKLLKEQTLNFILAVLLCYCFVYAMTDSLRFNYGPLFLLPIIALSLLVCSIVFYSRKTLIITSAAVMFLLLAALIVMAFKNVLSPFIYDFWVYIYWVINYVQGFVSNESLYALITTLCLVLALSAAIYFISLRYHLFLFILASGMSLFITQWLFGYLTSYTAFYLYLFVVIVSYFRYIFMKNVRNCDNRYVSANIFTAWALPLCALIFVIAFLLPAKAVPVKWNWLDNRINQVYNYFNKSIVRYKTYDTFTIANSGFGSDGSLGGKVKLNKTVVMKVDSPRIVYLKGSSSDYYTGTSWKNTEKPSLPLNAENNALHEDLARLMNYFVITNPTTLPLETYYYKDTLKISFANLHSKPLFTPLNTTQVKLASGHPGNITVSEDGTMASKKVLSKGFSYTVDVFNGKYEDEKFKELMRLSRKGTYTELPEDTNIQNFLGSFKAFYHKPYASWDNDSNQYVFYDPLAEAGTSSATAAKASEGSQKIDFITNPDGTISVKSTDSSLYTVSGVTTEFPGYTLDIQQMLKTKKLFDDINNLYQRYLQLPPELPKRVKDLAQSITAKSKNNYDKVKAIEQYLSKNYPYTLSPKKTPKDRDFVDYFLFDLKQGYCSYYATAMTVLVRSIGLPARYVEGYILPPTPKYGKTYDVTNEQAHAWVEVYFDGVGWIPFEPTSAFTVAFYNTKDYIDSVSKDMAGNPYYSDYLEIIKKYGQHGGSGDVAAVSADIEVKKHSVHVVLIIFLIIGIIMLGILSLVVVNWARYNLNLRNLDRLDPKQSILSYYLYYLKVLSRIGVKLETGETPTIYSQRVDGELGLGTSNNFREVSQRFILARYSQNQPSIFDKHLVSGFNRRLENKTRFELGKFKYVLYKYFLGKL